MKDLTESAFVASAHTASTSLNPIDDRRLPTEFAPKQIPKSEIQALDESYIQPEEQGQQNWEWINKETLHQLQYDIRTLEKLYEEQETAFLKKVFACELKEEKEQLETKYFKSRQTAKDMINKKKIELAQKIDKALITDRYASLK